MPMEERSPNFVSIFYSVDGSPNYNHLQDQELDYGETNIASVSFDAIVVDKLWLWLWNESEDYLRLN